MCYSEKNKENKETVDLLLHGLYKLLVGKNYLVLNKMFVFIPKDECNGSIMENRGQTNGKK